MIGVYDENSVYVLGSSKTRDATQSHEIWNDVKISIGLTFVTLMINLLTIILKIEVVINVFLVIQASHFERLYQYFKTIQINISS